jgi:hypothetical protein
MALEDNSFSNHLFSWDTFRYEDRLLRFTLKARLDALPSPQKINFWSHGKTKSRCPFCGEVGATLKDMRCACNKRGKDSLVMKRHDRVGCIVGQAARFGHQRAQMKINDDQRIENASQLHDDATQKAMRPGLVLESTNDDDKLCWQLVEVTCPWSWIDHDGETLKKAYDQLRREIKGATIMVSQATIVVSATGAFMKQSQAEFAKVKKLEGKHLAPFGRDVVDAAIRGSFDIYTDSMSRIKYHRDHQPTPEEVKILEEHELDCEIGEDEEVDEVTQPEMAPTSL